MADRTLASWPRVIGRVLLAGVAILALALVVLAARIPAASLSPSAGASTGLTSR